jgi:hypothetical protein
MPKQFLHISQICSVFYEVCGETVPKRVKRCGLLNFGFCKSIFENFLNSARMQFASPVTLKNIILRAFVFDIKTKFPPQLIRKDRTAPFSAFSSPDNDYFRAQVKIAYLQIYDLA